MVFAQALEIGANGVLGHGAGYFHHVALSDQARQRRTSHDEAALLGGLEQDDVTMFQHCDSPSFHQGYDSYWMQTATCWAMAVIMTTGIAVGQQRSKGQVKVLTVCEVLGNVTHYADTAVAVVGRMERSVSLIDHYEFLSQDRCPHPVITHGHVWSNKIQIWTASEPRMPKPPGDRPKLEESVLAAKLLVVRQTTKLGFQQEPRFKAEGRSIVYTHTAAAPNEWAAVYGRIVRVLNLNEDCGAGGCGGDNVPLVIIAESSNVHRLAEDGRRLPENE